MQAEAGPGPATPIHQVEWRELRGAAAAAASPFSPARIRSEQSPSLSRENPGSTGLGVNAPTHTHSLTMVAVLRGAGGRGASHLTLSASGPSRKHPPIHPAPPRMIDARTGHSQAAMPTRNRHRANQPRRGEGRVQDTQRLPVSAPA